MKRRRLSLGLDVSTQSIAAVVLDIDRCTKVYECSLDYVKDPRLNIFGLRQEDYILPPETAGEASQPPELYFTALDAVFSDLKNAIALEDAETLHVTGGARKSREILRRVAAIWNRPVTAVAGGGAALGAAVAGAVSFLRTQGETIDTERYIGSSLLEKEPPYQPSTEDIMAFHRPGGYLDRFAAAEARLLGLTQS
jgi:sugar (pentulose or hexulose) kinase